MAPKNGEYLLSKTGGKMFAVIKTGGKQYRVSETDVIEVELLEGADGDNVEFGEVLLLSDGKSAEVGAAGSKVLGKIVAQGLGPKLIIQKHKRRKNSRTKTGHRQQVTFVEITSIKKS
jgi:large subunit ribosomal protein L21